MNEDDNKLIGFHCALKYFGCGNRFYTTDYTVEPYAERQWLPFTYAADCPICHREAKQDHLQIARWKAIHDNGSAGPKSEEGIERIKEGNQNRDESSYRVSRFNAITHGENCKKATLYPARPGQYDQCQGCEWLDNGCGSPEMQFCQKRNEIYLQIAAAVQSGDPSKMSDLFVGLQTNLIGIGMDMARSIMVRGVEIVTPVLYEDKEDGRKRPVEYLGEDGYTRTVMKVEVNPLIPVFSSLMKNNKMDLSTFGLTPERKEEEKIFKGNIDDSEENETNLALAQAQRDQQMDDLLKLIKGDQPVEAVVVEGEVLTRE